MRKTSRKPSSIRSFYRGKEKAEARKASMREVDRYPFSLEDITSDIASAVESYWYKRISVEVHKNLSQFDYEDLPSINKWPNHLSRAASKRVEHCPGGIETMFGQRNKVLARYLFRRPIC